MTRKDVIFQCLCDFMREQNYGETGVDSSTIAQQLQIDRSNVSRDLNELVREGKVQKKDGRPVLFFVKRKSSNSALENPNSSKEFFFMIGQEDSLKTQIQQGKSAVIYPAGGLHILLSGPTGTGKTIFAEGLYRYAKKMGALAPQGRFVVFNCAEYAENPQLLLSQLFGYRKSAFTGADRDKEGLIEIANGGILFLDEIHRLPPSGQEMLFLVMDKGIYRRLGDTQERQSRVFIIGATTEDLNTALLQTFLRRMPVVIYMPSLKERPLLERLQLLEAFLWSEQQKIQVPLRICREAVMALLLYSCPGNIGQLQVDVQLLCARAFLEYRIHHQEAVEITLDLMPENIQNGRLEYRKGKNELIDFLANGEDIYQISMETLSDRGIYEEISQKFRRFHTFSQENQEILRQVEDHLGCRVQWLIQHYGLPADVNEAFLSRYIASREFSVEEECIRFAEFRLGKTLDGRIRVGLMLHLHWILNREEETIPCQESHIHDVILNNPKEYKVAKLILKLLEEEMDVAISNYGVGPVTLFLCADGRDQRKIGLIVLMHGASTASSMADVANETLGTSLVQAVNMPQDAEAEAVLDQTSRLVEELDQGKGVLLLMDMGAFSLFPEMIHRRTGRAVSGVGAVSTAMVIDAAQEILLGSENLTCEKLANLLMEKHGRPIRQEAGYVFDGKKLRTILITCFSGHGTAQKIRNMVREILFGGEEQSDIFMRCLNIDPEENLEERRKELNWENIAAVVGTVDLQAPKVPYISIEQLIFDNGFSFLEELLDRTPEQHQRTEEKADWMDPKVLAGTIQGLLFFLDAAKVTEWIYQALFFLQEESGVSYNRETAVRFVVHSSCMLERLLQHEVMPYPHLEEKKAEYGPLFSLLKEAFQEVETVLQLEVPETELAYLVEILTQS